MSLISVITFLDRILPQNGDGWKKIYALDAIANDPGLLSRIEDGLAARHSALATLQKPHHDALQKIRDAHDADMKLFGADIAKSFKISADPPQRVD